MKIVVLGAGAWGTALAVSAAAHAGGNAVTLWARDEQQAAAMQAARCNQRYLPGLAFAPALQVVAGDARALAASAELIVIGTPMAALRGMLQLLKDSQAPIAWLCKGFEAGTGLMAHEVCAEVAPQLASGVLSGPSFAQEVARAQPRPWWRPAAMPPCATRWCRRSMARRCASMPARTSSAWRWAAR